MIKLKLKIYFTLRMFKIQNIKFKTLSSKTLRQFKIKNIFYLFS